jgi:hypothetical protein
MRAACACARTSRSNMYRAPRAIRGRRSGTADVRCVEHAVGQRGLQGVCCRPSWPPNVHHACSYQWKQDMFSYFHASRSPSVHGSCRGTFHISLVTATSLRAISHASTELFQIAKQGVLPFHASSRGEPMFTESELGIPASLKSSAWLEIAPLFASYFVDRSPQ